MSDILLRYLLMARQRDRSSLRRFFGRHDQLLGAGVEQLVESAAVRVTVRSQHERHEVQEVEHPVIAIGLLPASGKPTPLLTCLAYLGSYTQRLIVLDRIYDTQLEQLLGTMRSERQSESLTVELEDGRRIRVIEVARPARLSDAQLGLALQALDGLWCSRTRIGRGPTARGPTARGPIVRGPIVRGPTVRRSSWKRACGRSPRTCPAPGAGSCASDGSRSIATGKSARRTTTRFRSKRSAGPLSKISTTGAVGIGVSKASGTDRKIVVRDDG